MGIGDWGLGSVGSVGGVGRIFNTELLNSRTTELLIMAQWETQ
jgi:hypothetical protein